MNSGETQIIAGKYELLRKLGQGGMGSVWYAQHLTLHSPVAIKLIDPAIATNPEALGRFLREAQSAAVLRSPHVVQILDHGVDNGVPYIAMELLEGESLADRLARVGRLSPAETARIVIHVCRAVGRAHDAGIVHRDLKPDNVFLVRNDDEEVAKVLDFGIAKATTHGLGAAASGATRTGALLGTPYYMSPEQAEGDRSLDSRADIWALGVITFECLLGRRPFEAETLGSLLLAICTRPIPVPSRVGQVPAGFDEWFARACSRDLAARFASAKELATELRRVCEGAGDAIAAGYAGAPHAATPNAALDTSVAPAVSRTERSLSGLAANESDSSASKSRRGGRALALGVLIALLGAGAGVAALAMRRDPKLAAASGEPIAIPTATAPPAPSSTDHAPAFEPVPNTAPALSASSEAVAAPANESSHASATREAQRVAVPLKAAHTGRSSSKAQAASTTAPAPAPARPAPANARVNLGI
ncbi:MAG TPA: protein kinase [Polyangiaceae bacterium]|jgi:serine/threonine-protein kinase|nr:protein kinase [Polyangiaceae bacterium]